jgi:hypothetical protein
MGGRQPSTRTTTAPLFKATRIKVERSHATIVTTTRRGRRFVKVELPHRIAVGDGCGSPTHLLEGEVDPDGSHLWNCSLDRGPQPLQLPQVVRHTPTLAGLRPQSVHKTASLIPLAKLQMKPCCFEMMSAMTRAWLPKATHRVEPCTVVPLCKTILSGPVFKDDLPTATNQNRHNCHRCSISISREVNRTLHLPLCQHEYQHKHQHRHQHQHQHRHQQ